MNNGATEVISCIASVAPSSIMKKSISSIILGAAIVQGFAQPVNPSPGVISIQPVISQAIINSVVTNNTFINNIVTNVTFINSIITNTTFVNSISNYLNTNIFNTFNATTLNSTTINVNGKATLNQLILTNGMFTATNLWAGPTNGLDVSIYEQDYASYTACSVTGFFNKSNSLSSSVLLSLANLAATNWDFTDDAGVVDGDFVGSHTVTNGTTGRFWFLYTPFGPRTNTVFRQL